MRRLTLLSSSSSSLHIEGITAAMHLASRVELMRAFLSQLPKLVGDAKESLGAAVGFRLDSLLKLTDTRATNNKTTLMHYLCKVLDSRSSHLMDFHKDFISLEAASKIQLKALAEEQQGVVKGLEKLETELIASENDGIVSEVFCKRLKDFTVAAGAEVRSLTALYTAVENNADGLALYFGEDPAGCPFEQVITTLLNFVRMFRRAHEENCKLAELEKKNTLKDADTDGPKSANSIKKHGR